MTSISILGRFIIACAMVATAQAQSTLYVDGGSPNDGPGADWAHAFHHLQDALAASQAGDTIRIAQGDYRPDQSSADPNGTNDRTATFLLPGMVAVEGGYAGFGAADPDLRDAAQFVTTLSGRIGAPLNDADNSKHVVTIDVDNAELSLDGVTIVGGFADDPFPNNVGGGLFLRSGRPILANCTFTQCRAFTGGGLGVVGGQPVIQQCRFESNFAGHAGAGADFQASAALERCVFVGNVAQTYGGGLFSTHNVSIVLIGCTFVDNHALDANGGAVSILTGMPGRFTHCRFLGNSAGTRGGAIEYAAGADLDVGNCAFSGNSAGDGGAVMIFIQNAFDAVFSNCTFTGNTASDFAAGIRAVGGSGPIQVHNTIFWNNVDPGGSDESAQIDGPANVFFSVIQDDDPDDASVPYGGAANGNLDDEPAFVDALGPDAVPGTEDDDLRLFAGSPCIDAGDSARVLLDADDLDGDGDVAERVSIDLAFDPRFIEDPDTADTGQPDLPDYPIVVDMGAFERQLPADLDRDGDVDLADWQIMANCLSGPAMSPPDDHCQAAPTANPDVDADGDVDLEDYAALARGF